MSSNTQLTPKQQELANSQTYTTFLESFISDLLLCINTLCINYQTNVIGNISNTELISSNSFTDTNNLLYNVNCNFASFGLIYKEQIDVSNYMNINFQNIFNIMPKTDASNNDTITPFVVLSFSANSVKIYPTDLQTIQTAYTAATQLSFTLDATNQIKVCKFQTTANVIYFVIFIDSLTDNTGNTFIFANNNTIEEITNISDYFVS